MTLNLRPLLLACLLALAPGCVTFPSDETVFVSSDPPGAAIHLNGSHTGLYTPAHLDVPDESTVELLLQGYPRKQRLIERITDFEIVPFKTAASPYLDTPFPLAWTVVDLMFPFRFQTRSEPRRIHVHFRPTDL